MYIYLYISKVIFNYFLKFLSKLHLIFVELSLSGFFRYLTGLGNACCGMHLVCEMSFGHLSGWEMTVSDVSGC